MVGWDIATTSEFPNGYRMIGRRGGGFAGGVLPLTEEMRSHGARPIWLGYVNVDDVDSALANMEADGASALLAPFDIPNVGRVAMVADPSGAPFYIMKPGLYKFRITKTGNDQEASFEVKPGMCLKYRVK